MQYNLVVNVSSLLSDDLTVAPPLSNPDAFSGLPIPAKLLDSNGWVHGPDGLLFWVPEDCRDGLTCPAITIIPTTGRHRRVRIDFTRFQYGTSWTNIRGSNARSES